MFRPKQKGDFRLNTDNTVGFNYKDKTKDQSRKSKFRESLYRSKSSMKKRSMYLIVLLPDKQPYYIENYDNMDEREEIHEWWAENTVDFLNEIQLIFGMLTDSNLGWQQVCEASHKTPEVGYPKGVKYMWKANRDTKPKILPVDIYVDHIIFWCNSQVENEDIFPTDEEVSFPPDFKKHMLKMYQRMFRIFGVIYSNECLYERAGDTSLELCFRHFVYFGWKWGLLDARETKCIDATTGRLKKKFDEDESLYRNKQLPIEE